MMITNDDYCLHPSSFRMALLLQTERILLYKNAKDFIAQTDLWSNTLLQYCTSVEGFQYVFL